MALLSVNIRRKEVNHILRVASRAFVDDLLVQADAGPMLHPPLALSALLIHKMFSDCVPVGNEATRLKTMAEDASSGLVHKKSDDPSTLGNAFYVNEATVRKVSLLDIFFNAQSV